MQLATADPYAAYDDASSTNFEGFAQSAASASNPATDPGKLARNLAVTEHDPTASSEESRTVETSYKEHIECGVPLEAAAAVGDLTSDRHIIGDFCSRTVSRRWLRLILQGWHHAVKIIIKWRFIQQVSTSSTLHLVKQSSVGMNIVLHHGVDSRLWQSCLHEALYQTSVQLLAHCIQELLLRHCAASLHGWHRIAALKTRRRCMLADQLRKDHASKLARRVLMAWQKASHATATQTSFIIHSLSLRDKAVAQAALRAWQSRCQMHHHVYALR